MVVLFNFIISPEGDHRCEWLKRCVYCVKVDGPSEAINSHNNSCKLLVALRSLSAFLRLEKERTLGVYRLNETGSVSYTHLDVYKRQV